VEWELEHEWSCGSKKRERGEESFGVEGRERERELRF